jgi:hypothetical protein
MSEFFRPERKRRVRIEMPMTILSSVEYNVFCTNEAMDTREIKIWQDDKLVQSSSQTARSSSRSAAHQAHLPDALLLPRLQGGRADRHDSRSCGGDRQARRPLVRVHASHAMKEFVYTIAMAQPIVLAYEAAWRENVVMTLFWLLIVLILHFMANEEALKR